MSVTSIILMFIFIGILPFMCGAYPAVLHSARKQGFLFVRMYAYGWLVLFASFEFVCVPFVVRLGRFSDFSAIYNVVIWVIAVVSVVTAILWNRHREKAVSEGVTSEDEEMSKAERLSIGTICLWVIIVLLIAAQMVYLYFYQHFNGDDAYYVAQSVLTDYHDTMFQRDSYTGAVLGLDVRHALSVVPIFITWLARVCSVHPTIMCHSILGPVLLAEMYCIFTLIARKLFHKNKSYIPVFLLFMNIWYIWGNVSLYTAETFAYTRTWQGKSIFANIVIPLAFCLLIDVAEKKRTAAYKLLFLLSIAGVFVTTASIYLLSMLYVIVGVWILITKRNKKPLMHLILCCIPNLVYGALYCYLLYKW